MNETTSENAQSSLPILSGSNPGTLILNRTREIDYVLEMTLDETRRMTKARVANLFLYNAEGNLEPFYQDEDEMEMLRIALYSIENHVPLNLIAGDPVPGSGSDLQGHSATQPVICTNLRTRNNENIGALYLRSPIYYDTFFEADLQLITSLGDSFSFLLHNGWNDPNRSSLFFNFRSGLDLLLDNSHLNQKMRESDNQLKAVLEVSNLINSSRKLNEMIEAVLYSARKVIRAERASVFLIDEQTGELYFDVVSGNAEGELTGIRIPPGKGIVGKTALEKRAIMVNDAQNDPQFYSDVDKASNFQTRNILAAPLLVDGEAIGVVEVLNTIDRSIFSEHDLEIFQSFSDSVAISLQRRKLLDDLQATNLQLEKKLGEVTSLHAVAAALVEAKTIEELFATVLEIIFNDLKVARASILMYNARIDRLEVVARKGRFSDQHVEKDQEDVIHDKLSYHVFITNRALYSNDLHKSEELKKFTNPEKYNTGSSIIIPLHSSRDPGPFGVICVSEPEQGDFSEEEYRLLKTIASQMVRGYENFKLNEEIMARQAFEKEVEITSRIQKNILPEKLPSHSFMELGAKSVMARTIGGDFYDFYIHGNDGNATMLVADVSGKSLPAALFMALSSSILRTIIRSETDPTKILSIANDLLFEESHSGMFVTVFLARYEPLTGRLRFASAGHNEMLLLHEDGNYSLLNGKGAPLGVIPGGMQQFVGGETRVKNGDMLVLYTDGVVEAVNEDNEEYGMDRFLSVLRENMNRHSDEIINRVYEDVVDFSGTELQYDDFTMMVSRFRGIINEARTYLMTLPVSTESVPVLRDFISDLCLRHGIMGQDRDDILISADEAATNIVLHAYKDLEVENPVFNCEIQIEYGQRFRLQFIDQGRFFDLENVESPNVNENLTGKRKGGFGVYLIRSLMTGVEYKRFDDQNYFIAEKVLKSN